MHEFTNIHRGVTICFIVYPKISIQHTWCCVAVLLSLRYLLFALLHRLLLYCETLLLLCVTAEQPLWKAQRNYTVSFKSCTTFKKGWILSYNLFFSVLKWKLYFVKLWDWQRSNCPMDHYTPSIKISVWVEANLY